MEPGPQWSVQCFIPNQLSSCLEELSLCPLQAPSLPWSLCSRARLLGKEDSGNVGCVFPQNGAAFWGLLLEGHKDTPRLLIPL